MSEIEDRLKQFAHQIIRTSERGCWTWVGVRDPDGYGRVSIDGHMIQAHRAVFQLFHGPIAEHLQVDHLCMNRSCVQPLHLEPVTLGENNHRRDRAEYAEVAYRSRSSNGA